MKVYLYLLRHRGEPVSLERIAEGLNHTEADIRRAIAYWEKLGVLSTGTAFAAQQAMGAGTGQTKQGPAAKQETVIQQTTAAAMEAVASEPAKGARPVYSQDQVNRLQGDGEFSELLYIAQRYLNKIFTQRELEVFAYLYDGLHMSAELLEYVVEHCVQGRHTSIRYIETIAISWHEKGFATVEQAKAYASGFTKNSFSVMRAFGLTGRNPGKQAGNDRALVRGIWFYERGGAGGLQPYHGGYPQPKLPLCGQNPFRLAKGRRSQPERHFGAG